MYLLSALKSLSCTVTSLPAPSAQPASRRTKDPYPVRYTLLPHPSLHSSYEGKTRKKKIGLMAHPKSQQMPMINLPWTPSPFLEVRPTPLTSEAGGKDISRKWLVREAGSHLQSSRKAENPAFNFLPKG